MAQKYCSTLCNLFGMCEYFMTTTEKKCVHTCVLKNNESE